MGALLTPDEMTRADALAIAGGISGVALMAAAGRAVADAAMALVAPGANVVVLCGPGNNGGDGYIAARALAAAGYRVRVAGLVPAGGLTGDAAEAAAGWSGPVLALEPSVVGAADLVIDGVFGAGLSRPVDGLVAETLHAAAGLGAPVVAVDVPSGVCGATGQIRGFACPAVVTVTFFRLKPGHLLYPGRGLCGRVVLADIGIPDRVLGALGVATWQNTPDLWRPHWPAMAPETHKYRRGSVAVLSHAAEKTGAQRLAARAALRIGAGLVTIIASPEAAAIHRAHVNAVMVRAVADPRDGAGALSAARAATVVAGPGLGLDHSARECLATALAAAQRAVLDADAITLMAADPPAAFATLPAVSVLTPHMGEFARLFPDLADQAQADRLGAARAAAQRSGAVIVLKGADTVIASADGRAAINANGPPSLATAGSGDVLAGFIAGLLGRGMAPFEAACAGVWLHGAAATAFGPGLIAEDLAEALPAVLRTEALM